MVNVIAFAIFNQFPPSEKTKIYLLLISVGWTVGTVLSLIISDVATLIFGSIRTSVPNHNSLHFSSTPTGHLQMI